LGAGEVNSMGTGRVLVCGEGSCEGYKSLCNEGYIGEEEEVIDM